MHASKKGRAGNGLMEFLKVEKTCEKFGNFSQNHNPHFSHKKTTFKPFPCEKSETHFFTQKSHIQAIPSIGMKKGNGLLPLPLRGGGSSKHPYVPSHTFLKGNGWEWQEWLEGKNNDFYLYGQGNNAPAPATN